MVRRDFEDVLADCRVSFTGVGVGCWAAGDRSVAASRFFFFAVIGLLPGFLEFLERYRRM